MSAPLQPIEVRGFDMERGADVSGRVDSLRLRAGTLDLTVIFDSKGRVSISAGGTETLELLRFDGSNLVFKEKT